MSRYGIGAGLGGAAAVAALVAVGATVAGGGGSDGAITVYKTPTCECCDRWEQHLREEGFEVESNVKEQRAINEVRREHGITPELVSCHVAEIEGYAVEGHVPAADIHRLVEQQPDIAGLAVPGMPIGSPGMEVPGQPDEAFDVMAFNEAGQTRVFSRHRP